MPPRLVVGANEPPPRLADRSLAMPAGPAPSPVTWPGKTLPICPPLVPPRWPVLSRRLGLTLDLAGYGAGLPAISTGRAVNRSVRTMMSAILHE